MSNDQNLEISRQSQGRHALQGVPSFGCNLTESHREILFERLHAGLPQVPSLG